MPFPDNPTGGLFLIQPAIRSPNYVQDAVGWTINADGSAQFFNVVLIGNDLKVLGANGSLVEIHSVANVARIDVQPGGGNVTPGVIASGVTGGGNPQLVLQSPTQTLTAPNTASQIILQGANATLPQAFINIGADAVQIIGAAGNSGVGDAVLDMGNDRGLPAEISLGISGGSSIGIDGGGLSVANGIALSTQTLDLFLQQLTLSGNRCYVISHPETEYPASAPLTLGGAPGNIPGCNATYINLAAGAQWKAKLITDAQIAATFANVTTVGELIVGGVVQAAQALHSNGSAAVSSRSTVTQAFAGVFAAGGSLTFQATGKFVGAGGVQQYGATHTKLLIEIGS